MKKTFTLIEILIVTVIFGLVLTVLIGLYTKMTDIRVYVEAKKYLVENSYFTMEKLNVLMKNYTIDYEEYFNRRIVGCNSDGGDNFFWDVGEDGYCKKFTYYGNIGDNDSIYNYWFIYKCSSVTGDGENIIESANLDITYNGCWMKAISSIYTNPVFLYQGFGQYKEQFIDYRDDIDGDGNPIGDYDDIDLGKGPIAVAYNTGVKELYLISKDKTKRFFLRRKLQYKDDFNKDGKVSDIEKWYGIEILKLRGFDAGSKHDFNTNNSFGVYDGQIDTWACDFSEGFKCSGFEIPNYFGYKLPNTVDDGWVNMTDKRLTITDLVFQIFPPKDPNYAWAESEMNINPYIRVKLSTKLFAQPWSDKINPDILSGYKMDLTTTFDIKSY